MDCEQAFVILDISSEEYETMTVDQLKKKYHIMALKYHPDKNKEEDAKDKFQKIQEAYTFLLENNDTKNKSIDINISYIKLMEEYINNLYPEDKTVQKVVLLFINKSFIGLFQTLIDNINKDILLKTYSILKEHNNILNIGEDIYEKLHSAIKKKYENENVIIINPSITDLLSQNIYILEHNNNKYYIPLWHHELHYDKFIVKCIPDFIWKSNSNYTLDHENNIHYNLQVEFKKTLLTEQNIVTEIHDKQFYIPLDKIKIKQKQVYIFKGQGIPRVNERDIYDNSNISDVVFHLEFI